MLLDEADRNVMTAARNNAAERALASLAQSMYTTLVYITATPMAFEGQLPRYATTFDHTFFLTPSRYYWAIRAQLPPGFVHPANRIVDVQLVEKAMNDNDDALSPHFSGMGFGEGLTAGMKSLCESESDRFMLINTLDTQKIADQGTILHACEYYIREALYAGRSPNSLHIIFTWNCENSIIIASSPCEGIWASVINNVSNAAGDGLITIEAEEEEVLEAPDSSVVYKYTVFIRPVPVTTVLDLFSTLREDYECPEEMVVTITCVSGAKNNRACNNRSSNGIITLTDEILSKEKLCVDNNGKTKRRGIPVTAEYIVQALRICGVSTNDAKRTLFIPKAFEPQFRLSCMLGQEMSRFETIDVVEGRVSETDVPASIAIMSKVKRAHTPKRSRLEKKSGNGHARMDELYSRELVKAGKSPNEVRDRAFAMVMQVEFGHVDDSTGDSKKALLYNEIKTILDKHPMEASGEGGLTTRELLGKVMDAYDTSDDFQQNWYDLTKALTQKGEEEDEARKTLPTTFRNLSSSPNETWLYCTSASIDAGEADVTGKKRMELYARVEKPGRRRTFYWGKRSVFVSSVSSSNDGAGSGSGGGGGGSGASASSTGDIRRRASEYAFDNPPVGVRRAVDYLFNSDLEDGEEAENLTVSFKDVTGYMRRNFEGDADAVNTAVNRVINWLMAMANDTSVLGIVRVNSRSRLVPRVEVDMQTCEFHVYGDRWGYKEVLPPKRRKRRIEEEV
jgi:hypothetical protein